MQWHLTTNRVWPFRRSAKQWSFCMLLCMVVGVVLIAGQARGGETTCPRYRVVLDGTTTIGLGPGGSYQWFDHMELHKVGLQKGYNGKWALVKYSQRYVFHQPMGPGMNIDMITTGITRDCGMMCTTTKIKNTIEAKCTGGTCTFDVVNNKVGSIEAGIWTGEIKGDVMTFKWYGGKNVPLNVGTITEGLGEKISVTVTAPKDNSKHVYNKKTPGELELTLTAKANPAKYNDKIKWTVPKIKGNTTKCTTIPDPPVGPKIKVTYSGLPEKNSEFGEKAIVAQLDVSGCTAEDRVDVEVFFPRDETNNPGPGDPDTGAPLPNWFYYWLQTSAATLASKARYHGFKCTQAGGSGVETVGYYNGNSLPDYYYICDLTQGGKEEYMKFEGNVWTFDAGVGGYTRQDITTTGIDTFALVSLHEAEHYTHLRKWWLDPKGNPIAKGDRVMKGGTQKKPYGGDKDGDNIPDSVEEELTKKWALLFDPEKPKTHQGMDDEELYTELVSHGKLKIKASDKVDWACPGKQCNIKGKKK